jgi:hypothetical protein
VHLRLWRLLFLSLLHQGLWQESKWERNDEYRYTDEQHRFDCAKDDHKSDVMPDAFFSKTKLAAT